MRDPQSEFVPQTTTLERSGNAPLPDEVLDALVMVLDEIRLGRSRSRAELVTRTGLGRAIVARRVQELIDRGLVTEGEVGPSTGGRPPRQLAFCADAGHVLVADLGATSIDVAVTSLDGRILGHHDEPARIEDGPERCLERVDALFGSLLRTTQDIPGRLWGIGIGVPGPVEFESGRPISPPIMPGWDGYPIRERFTEALRGAGLGRQRREPPRARGVAIGRRGGTRQRRGRQDRDGHRRRHHLRRSPAPRRAGERRGRRAHPGQRRSVGRLPLREHRLPGGAGRRSCPRSGRARRRRGKAGAPRLQAALDQHGSLSAEDVARAASYGDPVAVAMLQSAGRLIGFMLASVVNFFNPSLIVIGGGVAKSPDQLMATIRETIYRRSLPLATRDLSIQRSSLGSLAGVIGASSMVVDQLFSRASIARWIEAGDPASVPDLPLARAG